MKTGIIPPTTKEARILSSGKANVDITQDAGTINSIKIYAI